MRHLLSPSGHKIEPRFLTEICHRESDDRTFAGLAPDDHAARILRLAELAGNPAIGPGPDEIPFGEFVSTR